MSGSTAAESISSISSCVKGSPVVNIKDDAGHQLNTSLMYKYRNDPHRTTLRHLKNTGFDRQDLNPSPPDISWVLLPIELCRVWLGGGGGQKMHLTMCTHNTKKAQTRLCTT